MKSLWKRRLIQGFVGSGLLITIFASFFELRLPIQPSSESLEADFSFEGVNISFYENEELAWQLESESAKIYRDEGYSRFEEVNARFRKNYDFTVGIRAESAKILLTNGNISFFTVTANFIIKNEPVQIIANELEWHSEEKAFLGYKDIRLTSEYGNMSGEKLKMSVPMKNFVLYQHGKAQISVDNVTNP